MKKYILSYDLGVPESHANYLALINHIKANYSKWARPAKSVWLIVTNDSVTEIREKIKRILDNNDKLIVVEITGVWATYNVSTDVNDWMKRNI